MKAPIQRDPRKSHVEQLEARIAPATIIVQNLNDSGAGSLRQAVLDANATPALDTVTFKAGLTGTVLLASKIDITAPIAVKGPGGAKIVLSGGGASQIFNVEDGDTTDSPAAFTGLVFTKGSAANGGAIQSSESITVTSCIFTGNTTTGDGGALMVNGGGPGVKVKITSSQFTGNTAVDGGALYLEAGGGTSIAKSIFTGNTAAGRGGGAYISHDGEDNAAAKIVVAGSVFVGNSAGTNSGGLWIDGDFATTPVTISNTRVSGNTAGGLGGGLYFEKGDLVMTGTTFASNSADSGGAIFFAALDTGSIAKSAFTRNVATSASMGSGTGGGAIALATEVNADALTVTASTFVGNRSAGAGGAISFQDGGSLKLVASVFTGNRAADKGGAISTAGVGANATALTVMGGSFSDNSAASGGAIDSDGDGAISISAAKFRSNRALTSDGGAMYLRSTAAISVVGSLFSENFAFDDGGGFAINPGSGTSTLTGLTVVNNYGGGEGGGILTQAGTTNLSKSLIRGNHAGTFGGGLDLYGAVNILTSVITGNTAKVSEGGVAKQAATTAGAGTKIFANLAPVNPNSN